MLLARERKNHKENNHLLCGTTSLLFICGSYTHHDDIKDIIQLLLDQTSIDRDRYIFCDLLFNGRLRQRLDVLEEIIEMLKNYGFKINPEEMNYSNNALHHLMFVESSSLAIGENFIRIARLLVDSGVNVNATNYYGDTAISALFRLFPNTGDYLCEIIQMLIERGININKKNTYGENALHCLLNRYNGRNIFEIAKLLIENKIDVNSKNGDGQNAIYYLLRRGPDHGETETTIKILEMLIEKGIDVNEIDSNRQNGLFYLSSYFHVKTSLQEANVTVTIAKMLLNKGINVHLRDNSGKTALQYFLSKSDIRNPNNFEMIELLSGHL